MSSSILRLPYISILNSEFWRVPLTAVAEAVAVAVMFYLLSPTHPYSMYEYQSTMYIGSLNTEGEVG